jgi:hypothetical protein
MVGTNDLIRNRKEMLVTQLQTHTNNLPDPDELNNYPLSTNDSVFFEILYQTLMDNILSFQGWLKKLSNCKKSDLISRLNGLKSNYLTNCNEIFNLEQELNELVEQELSSRISSMKIFENLNAEKPTPLFLCLTKTRDNSGLEKINKNGVPFESDQERHQHIYSEYEKLFRKKVRAPLPDGVIEDFLGHDIVNSDIVRNSKLTEQEKNLLEAPLSLAELDISVKKAKLRSAPGVDGYTNVLIQHCWKFLRLPYLRYCNYCYDNNSLSTNFRSARIRLIPKKGDTSALKNWRPISLLSNLYKILSRALNLRLNRIVNRICSRAQKGYNSQRYTQEVLINVWEKIAYCKKNNIKGALVAIDMAKAFDTLSHDFIDKVYEFFNIGPCMRKWLNLAGNNRQACISLSPTKDTPFFDLGQGRPQGDNLSPNSFNFAEQILIFKLELDPAVLPIPRVCPQIHVQEISHFRYESNHETSKNESLADDNTTLTLFQEPSLVSIRDTLINFENISGLACNFDKTCIMPMFDPGPGEVRLAESLNLKLVDKVTLLGVEISRNLDNVAEIFARIRDKIILVASYWERFRLSLPGRITVAKTFLVSQLNYVACWLVPPEDILTQIQNVLDNFVIGNLNISRQRVNLPINKGGLGMFHLPKFLGTLQCAWIKRAASNCIDNWRYDLKSVSPDGDVTLIRSCDLDPESHPILHNLVKSYETFVGEFSKHNGNYKLANIFCNPAFYHMNTNQLINKNFFGLAAYNQHAPQIRRLRFIDCFHENGEFKDLTSFRLSGIALTAASWMRLQTVMLSSRQRYKKPTVQNDSKMTSVITFFNSFRKGSKNVRLILDKVEYRNFRIDTLRSITTFAGLINLPAPVGLKLETCIKSWNMSCLNSALKVFIFKFRNNTLPLSNRVANFDRDVDPNCSFCRMRDPDSEARESLAHCFFDCESVHDIIFRLSHTLFDIRDPELVRTGFWYGIYSVDEGAITQSINLAVWDAIRYNICKFKKANVLPNFNTVFKHSILLLKTTLMQNKGLVSFIREKDRYTRLLEAMG